MMQLSRVKRGDKPVSDSAGSRRADALARSDGFRLATTTTEVTKVSNVAVEICLAAAVRYRRS